MDKLKQLVNIVDAASTPPATTLHDAAATDPTLRVTSIPTARVVRIPDIKATRVPATNGGGGPTPKSAPQSVDSEGEAPNTVCLIMAQGFNPHAGTWREECPRLHAPIPKTLRAHIKARRTLDAGQVQHRQRAGIAQFSSSSPTPLLRLPCVQCAAGLMDLRHTLKSYTHEPLWWPLPVGMVSGGGDVVGRINRMWKVELKTALNSQSQSELLDALSTHWKPILSHYAGVVGVTAVGLLFAVLLPLVGLFVCCCRCAGRCGARSQPFEKKRDPCRRITLGIFLSAITIVILFGVVCAFVTNQYMEDGIKQLPSRLRTGLSDTDLYLDNTNKEFTNLLVTNYEELQSTLITVLNNAGKTVQAQLKEASNATILTNLTNLVDTLNIIKDDMSNISYYVATLQSNTAELNSTLGGVKSELERILAQCQVLSDCRQLLEKAKNLSAANFDELPSINNSLVIVNDLFSNENGPGLVDSIKNSQTDFEDLQKQVQEHIDDKIPEIKNTMSQAGDSIKVIANKISSVLNTTRTYVSSTNSYLESGQKYIKQYSPYRYYMDVALSSTLLLILLCLTLGLFFGFCGKRPDEYGGDCCTRGTGARFLITAVVFMFLFSIFLMVATLVHFLLGVVGEKLICETLKNPNNNQVLSWIDQQVNTNNLYPNGTNPNIKLSIRCGDQIQHLFNDLKTLTFTFNANFSILPSATKNKLKDLKSSFLSFNFLEFDKLQNTIVNINLNDFASQLDNTAKQLEDEKQPDMTQLALQLRNQSAILKDLQNRLVQEMTVTVQDLKNKTAALQEDIKFNHSSLDVAIEELITNVESAEDYIRQNGSNTINNLVTEFLDTFVVFIRSYLNRVIDNVLHKVGLSGPLATAYNSAIVSSCNQVLDPFNGFWASIGWSLILFIPAIVLCLMLASLYNKSDPYPGPLVESEYLYDAYADRDNIPLANVHDKKAHHRRYDETYDNSTGYMGDYSAHLGRDRGGRGDRGEGGRSTTPAHQNDARYTDMAPKYTRLGYLAWQLKRFGNFRGKKLTLGHE
uniref:Prominin-like protein n=2 Tax=Timema TaxID=61471 RepID=A0A7R8VHU7_TIMDO|nr:unnamed protein product [Timema douglasi]